jgi:hypothetical protein
VTDRNISQDLKISKLHLDDAAESQGEKERFYGDAVADAQKARDDAENRLDLRSGELWIEMRGSQLNGKAPTAEDVKAMVARHPEIVQLKQDLATAAHGLKLAQSAERAIQSTKSMIETLQRLHGASYFSTPSAGTSVRGNLPGYRPET